MLLIKSKRKAYQLRNERYLRGFRHGTSIDSRHSNMHSNGSSSTGTVVVSNTSYDYQRLFQRGLVQ